MAMALDEYSQFMPGLPNVLTAPGTIVLVGLLIVLSGLFKTSDCLAKPSSVRLVDNGYEGVVLAIRDDVAESEELIKEIKNMFIDASYYLYNATRKRAYFKHVTILIPQTWNISWDTIGSPLNYTYDAADIIVTPHEPPYLANLSSLPAPPHCKYFEGCGKQAAYIQFSSDFLTRNKTKQYYGNFGRLFVHEWGHFRWGLFDEYPDEQADQLFYNEFFYSSIKEEYQATRCSAEWNAVNIVFDNDKGTYRECAGNSSVGFEEGCFSVPTSYQNRTSGSIMYGYTNIEEIIDFCDNNTDDEAILHVTESPSKHNRICDLKSSWEVMREHHDFANDMNLPQNLSEDDILPNIVLTRVRPLRLVMVLDTSGSMGGYNRIMKQAAASMNFIMTTAIDGMSLGIVDFDNRGKRVSGLVKIDSETGRRNLAKLIPKHAEGGTCIGCGLEVALEILQENDQLAEGGIVILITDGKDTSDNGEKTEEMKQRYADLMVKIYSVAFSHAADQVVPDLASTTGGRFFLQTDDIGSTGLHDAFHATVEDQGLWQERPIQLFTESINVSAEKVAYVLVDDSVGHRTTFEFVYYEPTRIDITVTSPSGDVINRHSPEYREEHEFQFIIIEVNNTAEPGKWQVNFNDIGTIQEILVSVSSRQPSGGVGAITATAVMNSAVTNVDIGEYVVLFSEVKWGFYPVLNCNVTATVERPGGSGAVQLQLFDNGAGADLTAGDGIYSRYFTQYTSTSDGFYGVQVSVNNLDETAVILMQNEDGQSFSGARPYIDPYQLLNGNLSQIERDILLPPGTPLPIVNETKVPQFMRRTTGGSNRVGGVPEDQSNDFIPPCKIRDLVVVSSSYNDSSVMLTFTAPGDDLDFGRASGYNITASGNISRDTSFEIQQEDILEGNLAEPQPYGTTEYFVVKVSLSEEESVTAMYFAVTAFDENHNDGEYSNGGQAIFRRYIPVYVPPPPTTTTTTTTKTAATTKRTVTTTPTNATEGIHWTILTCVFAGIFLFILISVGVTCLANSKIIKGKNKPVFIHKRNSDSGYQLQEYLNVDDIPMTPLSPISNVPSDFGNDGFVVIPIISSEIHDDSTLEVVKLDSDSSSSWSSPDDPTYIPPVVMAYPSSANQNIGALPRARKMYNASFDKDNIPGQYF